MLNGVILSYMKKKIAIPLLLHVITIYIVVSNMESDCLLFTSCVSEISWTAKKIQPVHPKGNQSWIFIGKTDAEAETPILWPPDAKSWLIWKDPDAGKDWRQEEKGMTEDEIVGWHHRPDRDEFE